MLADRLVSRAREGPRPCGPSRDSDDGEISTSTTRKTPSRAAESAPGRRPPQPDLTAATTPRPTFLSPVSFSVWTYSDVSSTDTTALVFVLVVSATSCAAVYVPSVDADVEPSAVRAEGLGLRAAPAEGRQRRACTRRRPVSSGQEALRQVSKLEEWAGSPAWSDDRRWGGDPKLTSLVTTPSPLASLVTLAGTRRWPTRASTPSYRT